MDPHDCPIDGCQESVPYQHLMCRRHWVLVPSPLMARVYAAWKNGAGAGTEAHANACRAAVNAVHARLQEARG